MVRQVSILNESPNETSFFVIHGDVCLNLHDESRILGFGPVKSSTPWARRTLAGRRTGSIFYILFEHHTKVNIGRTNSNHWQVITEQLSRGCYTHQLCRIVADATRILASKGSSREPLADYSP